MLKTEAYEEITNGRCPLADNLHSVNTLLDYLVTKHALTEKQRKHLTPKRYNLELGHYHGLPKPHKVSLFQLVYYNLYSFSFPLAWNTITTYSCMYACTSNFAIEVFE